MADGIDKSVNLKMNFDGRGVVSGVETTKQAIGSLAATLKKDFDSMEGSTAAALAAIAGDIRSIDSELTRLGRSVNRGSGIDQAEAINALVGRINLLKSTMQQVAPDNFMEEMSNDALVARANLSHVETMLNRIKTLQATIDNQRGVRGIYDSANVMSVNDPRFQNALLPQRPNTLVNQQGTHDVLQMIKQTEEDNKRRAKEQREEEIFYQRLEREENKRKRQEEKEWNKYVAEETRKEERDFYQTLGREEKVKANKESERLEQTLLDMRHRVNPVDEVNQRLRPTTYQEHAAYGMVREASEQAEVNRRVARARELDKEADYHYEQQRRNNIAAERQWIESNRRTTPLYQLDTSNSLDLRYQHILKQEELERNKQIQNELFTREMQKREQEDRSRLGNRQGPGYSGPVYGPFQPFNDPNVNKTNRRDRDYDGINRRQFIAQQAAFGLDDIVQQYIWSNSTASGISAAARAGGNNLTAIAGAMNIAPMAMVGSMVGIQGISFAISSIARYYEEIEKARVSTKELENQLDSLERQTQKELKFKYSLEDKDSKELTADQKEAERELEGLEKGKYKESADRLARNQAEKEALLEEQAQITARVTEASKNIGPGGVPYISAEDKKRSKYIKARIASLDEEEKALKPDAEKYHEEKMRIEDESEKRKAEIEKKRAAEERADKRKKDGDKLAKRFWDDIEAEQQRTGVTLSGEEVEERWSNFVAENPHLNLGRSSEVGEEKRVEQDRKYKQARNDASNNAWRSDEDYQIERDYRNDRYGREKIKYQKELKRIERELKNASPEERQMLRENAREQLDYDIGERTKEYDKSLRSNYKALSGITAGSEEEAQLRAKLTVDSGMKSEQEKQTKHLETIAANTKPRKPPEPRVVSIA